MIGDRKHGMLRWWIWCVYAALTVVGIPWYWPRDDATIVLGLPAWVVVALGVSVAASGFTLWLLLRYWPPDDEAAGEPGDRNRE